MLVATTDLSRCQKCGGQMRPGIAMAQTFIAGVRSADCEAGGGAEG